MQKLPALIGEEQLFCCNRFDALNNKCGLLEQLKVLGYSVEPVH
jgi:hypothetical protein